MIKMSDAFKDLDWAPFLKFASEHARTPYGKAQILSYVSEPNFAQSLERSQELQNETYEVAQLIDKEALWGPLRDLAEVHEELELLRKGGVLEAGALSRLRSWLYCIDAWIQFPRDVIQKQVPTKRFVDALQSLCDPFEWIRELDRVLTPSGEISEKASPKLAALFDQIRSTRKEIALKMESLLRDYSEKGVLQERFTDVRDGRYVLPVKVSEQSKVEGRVTELSVSKQTVFIEPKEVELLNAQLRRKEAEASEEIFRILTGVSQLLRPKVDLIDASIQIVSYWDAVQAKARVAKRYGGRMIALSPDRSWILSNTVNPVLFWMLSEDQIVRNTIELFGGEQNRRQQMILLSGPNTGGKTVLLKTLGLSALAARTGFFYPGAGDLKVPFFDSFFVDLGDPQSIEEHVSSFSGHVLKMKRILEGVGPRSLILVDEMNSATDPEEGAALALAFVETVLEHPGAVLVATTHDPRLKAMGAQDPRVVSASILFNEETLKPTYRVVFGAPGRSRAIETAERLGIQKKVLDRARSFLSQEHQTFEKVLQQLQEQLGSVDKARREAHQARDEANRLRAEWEEKVRTTVQDSMEKARTKLKHVLELAQIEVRETVRKIQSTKTHKQLDEIRSELNEAFQQSERRIEQSILEAAPEFSEALEKKPPQLDTPVFQQGMWVRVPKWKNVGEIIEWDGKKARVALGVQNQSGMGKAFVVTVYPIEMEPLTATELKQLLGVRAPGSKTSQSLKVQSEPVAPVADQIDLRGQRLDEAMRNVTQYLDHAFRSGKVEVTVVHGLGTGAIREGVRSLLKQTNYIAHFQDAGSSGATLVRFVV